MTQASLITLLAAVVLSSFADATQNKRQGVVASV